MIQLFLIIVRMQMFNNIFFDMIMYYTQNVCVLLVNAPSLCTFLETHTRQLDRLPWKAAKTKFSPYC